MVITKSGKIGFSFYPRWSTKENQYKSPTALLDSLPVESAPFFVPSTHSVYSPPDSPQSCAHHLNRALTFAHHLSYPQSFTPGLKLISFTNPSSIVSLVLPGLPRLSRILNLYRTKWALSCEHWRLFVLVSSFFLYLLRALLKSRSCTILGVWVHVPR